VELLRRIQI